MYKYSYLLTYAQVSSSQLHGCDIIFRSAVHVVCLYTDGIYICCKWNLFVHCYNRRFVICSSKKLQANRWSVPERFPWRWPLNPWIWKC